MWKVILVVILSSVVATTAFEVRNSRSIKTGNTTCVEGRKEVLDCSNALPRAIRSLIKYGFLVTDLSSDNIGAPICTWFLIAFLAQYSTGKTQKQLLNSLELENPDEVRCISKIILSYFQKDPVDVFGIYSFNILADKKFRFPDNFVPDLLTYVGGKAHNYNFKDPEATAIKINKVISSGTLKNVQNTVSPTLAPKIFNDLAKLVSVSGLFFTAPFKKLFDRNNVTQRDFHVSQNRIIQVPFVYQKAIYKYRRSRELDAQLIQLEFKENSYEALLILPNKIDGLKSLIEKIATNPQLLQDEISKLKDELIQFYCPIFKNESSVVDAMKGFKKSGEVNTIFNLKLSQISDSCGRPINQTITSITQKIRADVVLFGDKPYKEPSANLRNKKAIVVNANHPSVYVVMKNSIPLLCVAGKVIA